MDYKQCLTDNPYNVLNRHLFSAGVFDLLNAEWEDNESLSLSLCSRYWNKMQFDITVDIDDLVDEEFETLNDFLTQLKPNIEDEIQRTFESEDVVEECIASIYGIDKDTIDKLLTDYDGMSKRAEDYENGNFKLEIS